MDHEIREAIEELEDLRPIIIFGEPEPPEKTDIALALGIKAQSLKGLYRVRLQY